MITLNILLLIAVAALGAFQLAHRQRTIERQDEIIKGLTAKLRRRNLFGEPDYSEDDYDSVVSDFEDRLENIHDLMRRGLAKDARHEVERALEHYA